MLSLFGWELPIPLLGINPDDAIAILWQKVRKMVLDHLIDLLGKIQSSHRYRSVSLSPAASFIDKGKSEQYGYLSYGSQSISALSKKPNFKKAHPIWEKRALLTFFTKILKRSLSLI